MAPAERRAARRHPWALCDRIEGLSYVLDTLHRMDAVERAVRQLRRGASHLREAHRVPYSSAPWPALTRSRRVALVQARALSALVWRLLPPSAQEEDVLLAAEGLLRTRKALADLEALHAPKVAPAAPAGECAP